MHSIYFSNLTNLPIMIDYWINHLTLDGLSELKSIRISPKEKVILKSLVDSWKINAMFPEYEDKELWKNNGLSNIIQIGSFRSTPCASGSYISMKTDHFRCVYSKVKNGQDGITGMISFMIL